jgi:multiple sugar transport system substrate-binding protein
MEERMMKAKVSKFIVVAAILAMVLSACAQTTPTPAPTQPVQPAQPAQPTEAVQPAQPAQPTEVVQPAQPTQPAQPAQPAQPVRMLVRPDEGGNVALFAERFTQETGIPVEVDFVGWAEIHSKTITTLASGGGGYDIVFIPSANAVEFASGGWFEPIDDVVPANERSQWLESVLDLYTYNGSLIAMPWYSGGVHMAYNASILEAAGLNVEDIVTWSDFMDACETIEETGAATWCFTPSAKFPGNFYFNWGSMVLSRGSDFFDEDGNAIFQNSNAARDAFEFHREGVDKGYFDPAGVALDDYETLIKFGTGDTAFMLNSTWSVTQANRNPELSGITGNSGLMLIPGNGGTRSAGYLYAGGLGLLKTSQNKEAAKQFLKYITSEEAQKHHAIEGANLPTRTALFTDPEIATAWPGFETLTEQLPYGKFPPQFTWFEEWRRQAASAVQDVMSGRRSAEDAVQFLVTETERISNQ